LIEQAFPPDEVVASINQRLQEISDDLKLR
jgi:hypothetical protein